MKILHQVARYYADKLAAHGPTARGADWNSEAGQTLRHQQFLRLLGEEHDASILDLGCGYGDFLSFVRREGFAGPYFGYDITPEMIAAARQLNAADQSTVWRVGATPDDIADYAVASGVLNVKGEVSNDDWTGHVHRVIDILARSCRRGFGFNVLTLSSDPDLRRPHLYYADPSGVLTYCLTRFGRSVALMQDYGLYEFTVIVRLSPRS